MGTASRSTPRALAALAAALTLAIAAQPAAAMPEPEAAPGRVLLPVAGGRAHLVTGVALPGGGALLSGAVEGSGTVYLAEVGPGGALEESFGSGGVAAIPARLAFEQVLVAPDGHILLVGMQSARGHFAELRRDEPHGWLVAVRLNPDGSLDRTYGTDGTARTTLEGGCFCHRIALERPGGGLVLTGQRPVTIRHRWGTQRTSAWALVALTPGGALDPSFGSRGVAVVPGEAGAGLSLEAGPDGSLIAQGQTEVREKAPGGGFEEGPANLMTRLTSTGAPDPSYAAGKPFKLPVFSLDDSYGQTPVPLAASTGPDGRVLVETIVPGNHGRSERSLGFGLVAYDPSGRLDTSFGSGGWLNFEEGREPTGSLLLREQDGSILAIHGRAQPPATTGGLAEPPTGSSVLEAEQITPAGAFDPAFAPPPGAAATIAFGGGAGEALPDIHDPVAEVTQALVENSFLESQSEALALQLSGGSLLLAGTVTLATPGRHGAEAQRFALAFLTPSFALDGAAGGPARPPSVTLGSARPVARPYVYRVRVPFSVKSSGPGLARIELFAGRRLIARRTVALMDGTRRRFLVQVPLNGRRYLHRHRRARVRAVLTFRDLFGQQASATLPSGP